MFLLLCLASGSPAASVGSLGEGTVRPDSAVIATGVRAVQAGAYNEAIRHLAPTVGGAIPRHPVYGSAATWLGRAFQGRGDVNRARDIWLLALRQDRRREDRPPPAGAADLFLRSFTAEGLQERASDVTEVYHRFLQAMTADSVSAVADTVLRRRAARLALIVPDSLSAGLSALADTSRALPCRTGLAVSQWLQDQDPILASPPNERITEHLIRVREAEQKYAWDERPNGLDDRGATHIRYGPPDRTTTVTYEAAATGSVMLANGRKLPSLAEADRASPDFSRASFPVENEVWIYESFEDPRHFIFVKRSGEKGFYRKGTARDLFPLELRRPGRMSSALTGVAEWELYLSAYSAVYEQLSSVDERYLSRYNRLYSYDPGRLTAPNPLTHVREELDRNERQNRQMQREREERMPQQQSSVLEERPSMPVAVRTARFLTEEGATRTEVYWGVKRNDLASSEAWRREAESVGHKSSGAYAIRVAGVLRKPNLGAEMRRVRTHTIRPGTWDGGRFSADLTLRSDADRQWVALEWMQHAMGRDGKKGPAVHITNTRTESRPALSADPSELEMSDLRLLAGPSSAKSPPDETAEVRRRVIPFDTIRAERSLALNFEVYHLSFGSDDRTRYTIEYRAEYEEERGGLAGLFGGTEKKATSAMSTYRGTSRQTTEYIVLDLGEETDLSTPTPVTIRVRVTDEVSGRAVSRPVTLTLAPEDEP